MTKAVILEAHSRINKIEDLLGEIWSAIGKEIIHFELNLNIQKITLQTIFKALNIKIDCNCPSIFEKTMTILEVVKYLPKKKLLIFINLGSYLNKQEMQVLEEYIALQNTNILLIDNYPFPVSTQTTIDEDLVVLQSIQLHPK